MSNCLINQVPGEFDIPNFCHIYSASAWHEDAFIIAGTDALLKIKETIDKALESGQSSCALFVNDGESFDLVVIKVDDADIKRKMRIPYTEDIAASNKGLCPSQVADAKEYLKEKRLRRSI